MSETSPIKESRVNHLRELREQFGITQQALQVRGRLSLNTITAIEGYGNYPEARTRRKLVSAINKLISETGNEVLITELDIWPE